MINTAVVLFDENNPLMPVLGMQMVERSILAASRNGIDHFIITGPTRREVRRKIEHSEFIGHFNIRFVSEQGEVGSILEDEQMLLIVADYLIHERNVANIIDSGMSDSGVVLGIAKEENCMNMINPIRFEKGDGSEEDIKYVFSGLGLCGSDALTALASIEKGWNTSLESMLDAIVDKIGMDYVELEEIYGMRIASLDEARIAEKIMLKNMYGAAVPCTVRYFEGRFSMVVTRTASQRKFSGRLVDVLSVLTAGGAFWMMINGLYIWRVVGVMLLFVSMVLRRSSRELAELMYLDLQRYKRGDQLLTGVIFSFVFAGIGTKLYWTTGDASVLAAGGLCSVSTIVSFMFESWSQKENNTSLLIRLFRSVDRFYRERHLVYVILVFYLIDRPEGLLFAAAPVLTLLAVSRFLFSKSRE